VIRLKKRMLRGMDKNQAFPSSAQQYFEWSSFNAVIVA
jgi:hypothetical protein